MPEKVKCDTHGSSEITYVCPHLLHSLKEDQPSGFHWTRGEDDEIQAFCDLCWYASDEKWEELAEDGCRIICLECLKSVAYLNDTKMEM